jgi:hypothetical protein
MINKKFLLDLLAIAKRMTKTSNLHVVQCLRSCLQVEVLDCSSMISQDFLYQNSVHILACNTVFPDCSPVISAIDFPKILNQIRSGNCNTLKNIKFLG